MLIDLSGVLSTEGLVKDFDVEVGLDEFSFNGNVYVVSKAESLSLQLQTKESAKLVLRVKRL